MKPMGVMHLGGPRSVAAFLVAAALAAFGEEPTLPGGVTLSECTLSDRAFDSKGYVTPAHLKGTDADGALMFRRITKFPKARR